MQKILTLTIRILVLGFLLGLTACVGGGLIREEASTGVMGPPGPQGPRGPQGQEGKPGKNFMPPPGEGLSMDISLVKIGEDQKPVVTLSVTDENGIPVAADTLEGYGFTIAQVEEDPETGISRYQSLLVREVEGKPYKFQGETHQPVIEKTTQAFADSDGVWKGLGEGTYTYTFKNSLTNPPNPDLVTVVGLYAYKNNRQVVVNDVFSYVEGGGIYPIVDREIVTNSACDLCHNPVKAHGGTRTKVTLCVTCHTDQTIDPETGNTMELKVLIHRLHFGRELPSVQAGTPYVIVGYRQNVFDFSKESWPQDPRYCITCHSGAAQSNNYKTTPNTAACTSCHDTINLSTGENHAGGKRTDGQCAACHEPEGDEFDTSITGAHTIPATSKSVEGIKLQILSVEGLVPGGAPLVKYKITNNAGQPLDPAKVAGLSVTMAGPTSDYGNRWTESIFSSSNVNSPPLVPLEDGTYEYQFQAVVPEDAAGSYAVAMEGYVMENIVAGEDPLRVTAYNPVVYIALDGGEPAARRQVIDQTSCNVCHMNIQAHGTIRKNVEYCVMCHNATATDQARRPAEAMPPTSINFPLLIHRLHRGEEASQPLQVYGYGNQLHDYSRLVFPGSLDNCKACHLPNTYGLPLTTNIQPTTVTLGEQVVETIKPVRALCTSCHDSEETRAHADLQTSAEGVESCNVCHGTGREFDVYKSHP